MYRDINDPENFRQKDKLGAQIIPWSTKLVEIISCQELNTLISLMTPSQLKKVKLQSNNGMLQPIGDIHIKQPFVN